MKKILVAYDGTPGADAALKDMVLAGLPKRADAKVITIADVWLPPAEAEEAEAQDSHYAASHDKAAEVLQEAAKITVEGAKRLHELFPNWTISECAKADSPAWGIAAEARRWGADLIVIGSHGRNPLEKFFLGSISFKVAAEAHCSVRVVRPHKDTGDRPLQILVGIDGSSHSSLAVEEVRNREWNPATEVHLVAVIDDKLKTTVFRKGDGAASTASAQPEHWLREKLEEHQKHLVARQLKVHTHIFEGDPKATVLRHAQKWDVDAILLGARGTEHGARLYLGTVASAICTRAHCTVEIVRPTHESHRGNHP